jgi:hypothetical protein
MTNAFIICNSREKNFFKIMHFHFIFKPRTIIEKIKRHKLREWIDKKTAEGFLQ